MLHQLKGVWDIADDDRLSITVVKVCKMYHELKAELVELEAAAEEARVLAKATEDACVHLRQSTHQAAKRQLVHQLDAEWEAVLQAQREEEEAEKQKKILEREQKDKEKKARCFLAVSVYVRMRLLQRALCDQRVRMRHAPDETIGTFVQMCTGAL